MDVEKKQGSIDKFRRHESDSGSREVEIALLTGRIEELARE